MRGRSFRNGFRFLFALNDLKIRSIQGGGSRCALYLSQNILECVSKREIRKFEQILCQFKEETRRLSSAKSRVDDAEMAQKMPKLRINEFLRHTLMAFAIF